MAFAGSAFAQPAGRVDDNTPCAVQKAEVKKRMEAARAKGQMLLRRQLADQLASLQSDCKPLASGQGRAENIGRLEREVKALRAELEAAEEQLRKLKGEDSR